MNKSGRQSRWHLLSVATLAALTCGLNGCDDDTEGGPPQPTATPTVQGPATTTPTLAPPSRTPTSPPTATRTATPTPTTPSATETPTAGPVAELRVHRVAEAPAGIDDPAWGDIGPFKPTLSNMTTGLVYGDGQLNMSGTFNGLTSFNGGQPAGLDLRAAHDGENIYILAQWSDTTFNLDRRRWLFNGPSDPLKPAESASGWTSQLNDDKIGLAFEIQSAESEFGTFANVGCQASCHNIAEQGQAVNLDMRPREGKVDIWHWKTSRSEPLGYVADQVSSLGPGRTDDAGTSIEHRNRLGSTNRSGPAFEWDGLVQEFERWDGEMITLDPAYILLDTHMVDFAGDAAAGEATFASKCAVCHGTDGKGTAIANVNFTQPKFTRNSRQELDENASASTHLGSGNYNGLTEEEKTNVLARLRGFSGIPGYYVGQPTDSVADIVTQSNVDYTEVNDVTRANYRVLMIRKLSTGHDDDAQFTAGNQYPFGVALMDNDGRNHIGSRRETLSVDP